MNLEDDYDDRRFYHRWYRYIITLLSLIALSVSIWGVQYAPIVDDLYHVINPGDRPGKGEGTYQYLFLFPGMLVAASILNWLFPNYMLRHAPKSGPGFGLSLLFPLTIMCGLLIATLTRVQSVMLLSR